MVCIDPSSHQTRQRLSTPSRRSCVTHSWEYMYSHVLSWMLWDRPRRRTMYIKIENHPRPISSLPTVDPEPLLNISRARCLLYVYTAPSYSLTSAIGHRNFAHYYGQGKKKRPNASAWLLLILLLLLSSSFQHTRMRTLLWCCTSPPTHSTTRGGKVDNIFWKHLTAVRSLLLLFDCYSLTGLGQLE